MDEIKNGVNRGKLGFLDLNGRLIYMFRWKDRVLQKGIGSISKQVST
jgi:hypothetical protein